MGEKQTHSNKWHWLSSEVLRRLLWEVEEMDICVISLVKLSSKVTRKVAFWIGIVPEGEGEKSKFRVMFGCVWQYYKTSNSSEKN